MEAKQGRGMDWETILFAVVIFVLGISVIAKSKRIGELESKLETTLVNANQALTVAANALEAAVAARAAEMKKNPALQEPELDEAAQELQEWMDRNLLPSPPLPRSVNQ